jgi:hypothetical protein
MKYLRNKLAQFKQWIFSIVIGFFDLRFLGFLVIFASFGIFGETEMWSWQMWLEILGVTIGGIVLIQYGKNCR